jgi:hypothetical protein
LSDVPPPPLSHGRPRRPRFWIVLPAILLILADAAVTFLFQPSIYWTGAYQDYEEISPLGSAILRIHPAAFIAFILVWVAIVLLIVALVREPWNRVVSLAVIIGHTAGIYGWLDGRSYWSTIPIFIAVAALTILCWRQADAR